MSRFGLPVSRWAVRSGALLFASGVVACLAPFGCTSTASNAGGGDAGAEQEGGGDAGGRGGADSTGSGGRAGSSGTPGECTPNETKPCWETPEGDALPDEPEQVLGDCRFGVKTCSASGTWGACLGAVAPAEEDSCEPGADEDCDGIPNEGCPCTDGETRPCGSDTGNCERGTQACKDGVWGACEGGTKAEAQDSCAIAGDDANCDGEPNGGCPCIGTQTEACGECGERTCSPEARDWGPCEPTSATEVCWETSTGEALPGKATDTGNCTPGVRSCQSDGNFGACEGAVGPASEDSCTVAGDDATCDGVPNGGCPCSGKETRTCGIDIGECRDGTQSCESGVWGECVGAIEPLPQDRCDIPGDDSNCNGIPNEGCPCVGNETQPCNDCGTRTCNPTARAWGACTAPQSPPATRCASPATGVQTCDSAGRWVTTACSPTNAHCSSRCEVSGGHATCVEKALDADGDGHGDALCTPAPGTDCDDSHDTVYPGAPEICDGLDNDCDGKTDLRDGLTLTGSNVAVTGRRLINLAWNPARSQFGWVALRSASSSTNGVYFGTLSTAGTLSIQSTPAFTDSSDFNPPRIAYSPIAGGSSAPGYGVVFDIGNQGGNTVHWVYFSETGAAGTKYTVAGRNTPSIAVLSTNEFLTTYLGGNLMTFGKIRTGQGFVNQSTVAAAGTDARVATIGEHSAVVYHTGATTLSWVRATPTLTLGTPQELTATGTRPDIVGTPAGYALAWRTIEGFVFNIFSTAGARVCGPTNVVFGNGTREPMDTIALAHTAYGTVVLATDQGDGDVQLFRFDQSCRLMDDAVVLTDSGSTWYPSLAVGGGKLAIGWTSRAPAATNDLSYVRVLNDRLCP